MACSTIDTSVVRVDAISLEGNTLPNSLPSNCPQ
jgi:hypothetical protein